MTPAWITDPNNLYERFQQNGSWNARDEGHQRVVSAAPRVGGPGLAAPRPAELARIRFAALRWL